MAAGETSRSDEDAGIAPSSLMESRRAGGKSRETMLALV
jgi:hypothetical protein